MSHAGTTISCRFSAPTLLLLAFLRVLGGPPAGAAGADQSQPQAPEPQAPAAPISPVPQLAPKPKPKPPAKPTPPPPKFPSEVKWSIPLDAAPLAPPLVSEGFVVLALRSGTLSARSMADGKEVWTVKVTADQPLAADSDVVFAAAGDTLLALKVVDGAVVWKAEIGKPTAPILARGGWVIVASGGTVTALRSADGEKIWSKEIGAISERAAIDGDGLYVPVTEGRLIALDLKTGDVRWEQAVGASPTEPLAHADRIYLGSETKRFVCLQAASGREEWAWDVGTRLIGPAAADESRVYFTAMDNSVRALSRTNGGRRWKYDLAYRPTKGPVVASGQVVVPGITTELPGINAESGKPSGKLTLPAQLAVGPTFVTLPGPDMVPAIASITGAAGSTKQWTLTFSTPPPDAPAAVPK